MVWLATGAHTVQDVTVSVIPFLLRTLVICKWIVNEVKLHKVSKYEHAMGDTCDSQKYISMHVGYESAEKFITPELMWEMVQNHYLKQD